MVQLPVRAYQGRLAKLAQGAARRLPPNAAPHQALAVPHCRFRPCGPPSTNWIVPGIIRGMPILHHHLCKEKQQSSRATVVQTISVAAANPETACKASGLRGVTTHITLVTAATGDLSMTDLVWWAWRITQAVEEFLWGQQRFRLPSYGRSNVPANSIVDHPGLTTCAVPQSLCNI